MCLVREPQDRAEQAPLKRAPQFAIYPPAVTEKSLGSSPRATPSQKPGLLSHVTDSPAVIVTQACSTYSPEPEGTLTGKSWFLLQQEPELSNEVQHAFRENV